MRHPCPAFSNTKAAEPVIFLAAALWESRIRDLLLGNHSQAKTTQPFLCVWDPFTIATYSGSQLRFGLWVESRGRFSGS